MIVEEIETIEATEATEATEYTNDYDPTDEEFQRCWLKWESMYP